MRHLPEADAIAALKRGKPVEQFLGPSPVAPGYIRCAELRPADGKIELWVHDFEDVGGEDYTDIYGFPYWEPDGPQQPASIHSDPESALRDASARLAADRARWVNLGVGQSEYLDYVTDGRAGQ